MDTRQLSPTLLGGLLKGQHAASSRGDSVPLGPVSTKHKSARGDSRVSRRLVSVMAGLVASGVYLGLPGPLSIPGSAANTCRKPKPPAPAPPGRVSGTRGPGAVGVSPTPDNELCPFTGFWEAIHGAEAPVCASLVLREDLERRFSLSWRLFIMENSFVPFLLSSSLIWRPHLSPRTVPESPGNGKVLGECLWFP